MITIPLWAIPTLVTAIVVVAGIWPAKPSQGAMYGPDIGGAFKAVIQLAGGIIFILTVWLAYFAIT